MSKKAVIQPQNVKQPTKPAAQHVVKPTKPAAQHVVQPTKPVAQESQPVLGSKSHPPGRTGYVRAWAEADEWFAMCDHDKDGKLNEQEATEYIKAFL